jgi:Schlafen, AlbA_2
MGFQDLRTLSDDDLRDWCLQRIEMRSPESDVLDYKQEFGALSKESVKLELAKDVSSFANERGGVLV